MNVLSVATLNVAGFRRDPLKIQQTLNEVKYFDIVCLQETHFQSLNECTIFNNIFGPTFKIFHSVIQENC